LFFTRSLLVPQKKKFFSLVPFHK